MATQPLRAAVYLRNSDEAQELSVDQQRDVVIPFGAELGVEIVREYADEGCSGSKHTEKRVNFLRMIRDGAKREFDLILTWDAARFMRLDSIEGGAFKETLRKSGIYLHTKKEGVFDWRTDEGRMKDFMHAEANKKHSLNVSLDSIRGRVSVARAGWWPHGEVPYGYDREYVLEGGSRVVRVKRGEYYHAGPKERLRLVVNEGEAEILRWVFAEYADGRSLHSIQKEVLARKMPSPTGGHWGYTTLRNRIQDVTYTGVTWIGKNRPNGKQRFNKSQEVLVKGSVPVIIDADLFKRVQLRQQGNKSRPQAKYGTSKLGGFLVCGHCGMRLLKLSGKSTVRYGCRSKIHRPHLGCTLSQYVNEPTEIPLLVGWLMTTVEEEIEKFMTVGGRAGKPEIEVVRAQVEGLRERYDRAQKNVLDAPTHLPPEIKANLWTEVERVHQQLTQAEDTLSVLEAPDPSEVGDGLSWFRTIKEQPMQPDTLRKLMTRFGVTVRYYWGTNPVQGHKVAAKVIVERKIEGVLADSGDVNSPRPG